VSTEAVRVAGAADEAALQEIWASARTTMAGMRGGAALMATDRTSSSPAPAMTWVSGDSVLEGTVTAWLEGEVGWLALWVAEATRGQGRGRQLAQTALAWLADQGATQFDALALPGDRATKQLFESLGFKARLLVMRREAPTP